MRFRRGTGLVALVESGTGAAANEQGGAVIEEQVASLAPLRPNLVAVATRAFIDAPTRVTDDRGALPGLGHRGHWLEG